MNQELVKKLNELKAENKKASDELYTFNQRLHDYEPRVFTRAKEEIKDIINTLLTLRVSSEYIKFGEVKGDCNSDYTIIFYPQNESMGSKDHIEGYLPHSRQAINLLSEQYSPALLTMYTAMAEHKDEILDKVYTLAIEDEQKHLDSTIEQCKRVNESLNFIGELDTRIFAVRNVRLEKEFSNEREYDGIDFGREDGLYTASVPCKDTEEMERE